MDEKEKAIAYDKALERAKDCLKDGTITSTAIDYISTIFPELAESEDERVRKDIMVLVKDWWDRVNKDNISTKGQMIAWLEKQKDTNVLIQEASEKAYTEGMRVERKHWLETAYFKQKSESTWSKEDEDNLRYSELHFKTFLSNTYYDTFCNWLKSLKERLSKR